jgi:hypothetical protein
MQPTPRHHAAEAAFRRLIEEGGLAHPDDVRYADDEVLFFWNEPKLCVVFDFEDMPQLQDGPLR